jgi:uncharacterized protein
MARTDLFDLGGLRLATGEGRRLELEVAQDALELAGERYAIGPELVPVTLEVSRLVGGGYSLRLRFEATLSGPCMRCLEPATLVVAVDARELDVPGGGEELDSPYVDGDVVDVSRWAHDAVALAAPAQVLCAPDCLGLCPVCAVALAVAGPDHRHEAQPDPRWEKRRGLRLE